MKTNLRIVEKILKIFRKIDKWILDSLEIKLFKSKKNCLTPRSVSLRRVRLRAVVANFKISQIYFSDSAQC